MKSKSVFIIWGAGGYPYRTSAAGGKFFLMAKALLPEGFHCILANKINPLKKGKSSSKGTIEGVGYYFLDQGIKNDYLSKFISNVVINVRLFFRLKELQTPCNNNFLIISYCPFFLVIYYRLISWMLRYRLIISVMEYHPALASTHLKKINAFFFWRIAFRLSDGVIPISRFLSKRIRKMKKSIPLFEIPVLADYNHKVFQEEKEQIKERFFLYCGSIGYYDVIQFIIKAFSNLNKPEIKLYLVVSGKKSRIEGLKTEISAFNNIIIYQNLTYDELYNMYKNAIALLIPMRLNQQDTARFPQKVAEYAASSAPIITNPVGEIIHYFEDRVNAVFAKEYTIEEYEKAMHWILAHPDKAKEIGIEGKKTGYSHFHYESIAESLGKFLKSIE